MKEIDNNSVNMIVTSPPYNQKLTTRDITRKLYDDNINPDIYLNMITNVFNEVYRCLKNDGSFFYNYKSDTKSNLVKPAFSHLSSVIQEFKIAGEIVWKYAGNFDSARTRFPIDYEMVFHLVKQHNFKFNDRKKILSSVWQINHVMAGSKERKMCSSHPCPYPIALIRKIIEHTTDENDIILDPFMGSGTTAVACKQLNRNFIGFEISKEYCDIANKRVERARRILTPKIEQKSMWEFQ